MAACSIFTGTCAAHREAVAPAEHLAGQRVRLAGQGGRAEGVQRSRCPASAVSSTASSEGAVCMPALAHTSRSSYSTAHPVWALYSTPLGAATTMSMTSGERPRSKLPYMDCSWP